MHFFVNGGSIAAKKTMNRVIKDFMQRGVVTCGVHATAAEVARIMFDNDVQALVMLDEHLNA